MAKKGDFRLKAYYDFEGDYCVAVQQYRGFFSRWSTVSRTWSILGRTQEETIRIARLRMEERKRVKLGVIE